MRANHKPPNRSRPAGDSRVPGPREIHILQTPRRVAGGAHRRIRATPNPSFFVVFLDTEKMVQANQGSNSPKKILLFTVKIWPHVKKTFKKGCHPILTCRNSSSCDFLRCEQFLNSRIPEFRGIRNFFSFNNPESRNEPRSTMSST